MTTYIPCAELETNVDAISEFVQIENARTASALDTSSLEDDIVLARAALENADAMGGVTRRGDWVYTYQQTPDNPRGQWLRLPDGVPVRRDADWEVVFDLDAFCAAENRVWQWQGAVTAWFDPDRVMLMLSDGGSDQTRHLEYDCARKSVVADGFDLGPSRDSVDWVDIDTLLWSTPIKDGATQSGWARSVRQLRRGLQPHMAPVVFEIDREDLVVHAYRVQSPDGKSFLGFSRHTAIGKESVTLRRDGQQDLVLPAPPDTEVYHNASHFAYVVQQEGPAQGALVLQKIENGAPQTVFSPKSGLVLNPHSILLTHRHLIWTIEENLVPRLYALDLFAADAEPEEIILPVKDENIGVRHFDAKSDVGDGTLQLFATGFTLPPTVYVFDLKKGVSGVQWRKLFSDPMLFDTQEVSVTLRWAISEDGTRVPYHLVMPARNHGQFEKGATPILMYGYGGFGYGVSTGHNGVLGRLWMEKGGGYVLAHIRGGSELGPDWHLSAKGPGRHRAFADFATIADDLVASGISEPSRIGCHGGSNGGLLCGVMLTRYPEKFGAIWGSVGVYDMMRFHLFPAGAGWIDEYGDPDDPTARAWLKAYSPMHHVGEGPYPPALIDTSAHDDRVDPSHSRRFAALLRKAGHPCFFYQHGDGGHGGGGSTATQAFEQALGYRFLWKALTGALND